ncbi:MAG: outer membrane lipoprotein-sorting protein [Polyangiaceae bacterium]|nr:outer membrane lipoprotein-sorting protein [Polyangiaceae bacterium]
MRLSHFVSILGATLALSLTHAPAMADDAGDKVLTQVDTALNKAKSHYFEYEATTQEAGKAEKKVGLNVWIKAEKRLTEFTAPADLKGTKVLILSPTEMYVYLPAFGKVRRIASHTSDQSAFGMAFSQDDLATQKYSSMYTATVSSSTDKEQKVTLTPKAGQTTPYSKIEMTVGKDKNLPTEIKYYNSEGKHIKTETRSGYSCESDVCTPATLKMVDHTKNLTTTMSRKKWKVNESINDDTFSKRNLEK